MFLGKEKQRVKERETKTSPFEGVQLPWPAIWGKTDKFDPSILWFHCGVMKRDVAPLFSLIHFEIENNPFMPFILLQRKVLESIMQLL